MQVIARTESRRGRRGLLHRFGVVSLVLAMAAVGLVACGDDDDDTGASGGGGSQEDVGAELAELLGVDEANAAEGEVFRLGAVLALSGPGSFYGKTMSRGTDLAIKHIKAAGGPDIQVEYWDHKSGDAAAGKQAMTEIVSKGIGAKLASYVDDLGAMLEDTAKNKVFTLDGGGGTSIFGQGVPYFWGTRAITPNDTLPGLLRWFKETYPDKKTVGLTGWDIGEPGNTVIREDLLAKIDAAGLEFNGLYELTPVGSQDYAAVLPKIKSNEPDLLLVGLYGQDPGSFLNQATTAGLESVPVGFEFTPDGINASKGSYDSVGWTFAYDYFDPENPVSPLAKLFVREFEVEYGEKPDFYAANFYENTLVLWELIRRVKAEGGDINSGEALNAALESDLTVVSVYGGDEDTVGSYTLDPETHSVLKREMGVFEYKGGEVTAKVFFGIGGEGYRKA
jgi:branched-chain amino acid transport system substrate-binding protein